MVFSLPWVCFVFEILLPIFYDTWFLSTSFFVPIPQIFPGPKVCFQNLNQSTCLGSLNYLFGWDQTMQIDGNFEGIPKNISALFGLLSYLDLLDMKNFCQNWWLFLVNFGTNFTHKRKIQVYLLLGFVFIYPPSPEFPRISQVFVFPPWAQVHWLGWCHIMIPVSPVVSRVVSSPGLTTSCPPPRRDCGTWISRGISSDSCSVKRAGGAWKNETELFGAVFFVGKNTRLQICPLYIFGNKATDGT